MQTILMEVLKFIGVSAAGGITWDIMKGTGSKILTDFKRHFVKVDCFQDEKQAENFLKDILTKESLNKRHPLEDIWTVYDNCTGKEASDLFKTEFIDWIETNEEAMKHLGDRPIRERGIFIQRQINKGHAQVTNIGNQYNYGGTKDKGEHSNK